MSLIGTGLILVAIVFVLVVASIVWVISKLNKETKELEDKVGKKCSLSCSDFLETIIPLGKITLEAIIALGKIIPYIERKEEEWKR